MKEKQNTFTFNYLKEGCEVPSYDNFGLQIHNRQFSNQISSMILCLNIESFLPDEKISQSKIKFSKHDVPTYSPFMSVLVTMVRSAPVVLRRFPNIEHIVLLFQFYLRRSSLFELTGMPLNQDR